jgi:vacuolar-type H+-ATPase subunit H
VDVQKKLDEIVAAVSGARSMPMSASCVVNRAELLSMLEEVRAALPGSLAQAQELIGDREQMVEQARQEAERIIQSAHAERGSLISDTEVARRSQAEADRILAEARREAEEIRAEADDYVDSKLANFEVVLTKTLEAVGRGRQKLHGRIATDDLGALADDTGTVQHTSDADYLAGLAALPEEKPPAEQPAQQQDYGQPQPAYAYQQQPDPYGGYPQQQAYAAQQDPYGYQQADPYAYQGYDPQQAAYDPNQAQQGQQGQQSPQNNQGYALDETSLFDTGMISAEQLRAYEQGRGNG